LVDDKGNVVSSIPKPTITDAKGATTTSIQYKLRTEKGQTFLDVMVDDKWLQDEKRVYPIVVDPTLTIQGATTTFDTFLASGAAYQNTPIFRSLLVPIPLMGSLALCSSFNSLPY
jgi:hypothetical protein